MATSSHILAGHVNRGSPRCQFRGRGWREEELAGTPDLFEAESPVEVLRPVIVIGHDEDVLRARLTSCLDGPKDHRTSDAPTAELFERADVLDLSVETVHIQL